MWIEEGQWNNRHDLHSKATSSEMPGTEYGPLHDLWKIIATFGCPAKFIAMVRQFHNGMIARVQNDGEFSDPFPVTNGVKQGCVLASTLFSMMFSAMLTVAIQDDDNGIPKKVAS